MDNTAHIHSVGSIFSVLADVSRRPRYAFLVLQLVSEIADDRGQAGPFVKSDGAVVLLREWLCRQLLPLSEQKSRRAALRSRVANALKPKLTGDPAIDGLRLDLAVEEQVRSAGRTNVSRAISDLARAGLVERHYAGYATNHENRGGGRNAVYVVHPAVRRLLVRPEQSSGPDLDSPQTPLGQASRNFARQGDLFW